ncbi:unnamed protein product [Rotaria sordida]|uniref:Protein quiver n=1 Tax=Rotaria sordida TaxID=392033 RepID=A0A813ZQW6_9BILA|nr:unnamed protein product [Rotaria sordida]CAF0857671.1 unnamed protein product [Rotaria sordida]CAF0896322.1 unnamed protein product [Rotaria sordida]CAF0903933.1 unnamed protein product [Rotaria sordida]
MKLFLSFFFCATIFLPTLINGLQCYECIICSRPFDRINATIRITNSSSESCYKLETGISTTRGAMDVCIQTNALGLGTWCCNTDLCNRGQSSVLMNLKIVISTFLLSIGLMDVLQLFCGYSV